MTCCARHQVEVLLDGLDILRLEETERDGHAFSGPKHWHTFDILAPQTSQQAPIGTGVLLAPFPGVVDVLYAAEDAGFRGSGL
jgi:hypothetical protein